MPRRAAGRGVSREVGALGKVDDGGRGGRADDMLLNSMPVPSYFVS